MGKKRGIPLAVLLVALLGGLIWILSPPTEPLYQGKPLHAWLNEFNGWPDATNEAAFVVFRELGTNAIPALLKIIQSSDPSFHPLQRLILELEGMQSLVNFRFVERWHLRLSERWNQRRAAYCALYAMGANAKPAFPTLTNLFFHTNTLPRGTAHMATMGSTDETFITAFCPEFLCAVALAGMGSEGLPPLLAALTNQNAFIRLSAACGLTWERSDLDVVVPALIARLSDQDSSVHRSAVSALGHLLAEPKLAVPALVKDYPDKDRYLRRLILGALARFGTNARAAVPMLLEALSDNDESVRRHAASALKRIDPAAAAKAGLE